MIKHNKKRNVALILEFFSKHISKCLIEKNEKAANDALNFFMEHFKDGTELKKEMRLVCAIRDANLKTETSAYKILDEIRKFAEGIDKPKINFEKTKLINEINRNFGQDFFDQQVSDYNHLASIQNLLEEYRGNGSVKNKAFITKFEEDVVSFLMNRNEKPINESLNLEVCDKAVNNKTVLKIMENKLKERYAGKINSEQRKLLESFLNINNVKIEDQICQTKKDLLNLIESNIDKKQIKENKYSINSLNEVKKYLVEEFDGVNDITKKVNILMTACNFFNDFN